MADSLITLWIDWTSQYMVQNGETFWFICFSCHPPVWSIQTAKVFNSLKAWQWSAKYDQFLKKIMSFVTSDCEETNQ